MKYLIPSLLIPFTFLLVSCEKAKIRNIEQEIIGTWVQIEPECAVPDCDTVIFRSSGIVTSNMHFIGEKPFEVVSSDTLRIGRTPHPFQMSENDRELFIEYFVHSNLGFPSTPITLSKISEQ
jgi:hypothetical protein